MAVFVNYGLLILNHWFLFCKEERQTSPAAESEEKRMFSQASKNTTTHSYKKISYSVNETLQ